ncbi:MAG: FlgD immunoglobulin-like domain containing protein [Candidatus Eiseniibacteriota bacterium]
MTARPVRVALSVLSVTAVVLAPAPGRCVNLYGWSISESNTDPFVNSGSGFLGSRTVYLWYVCNSSEGLAGAEFNLAASGFSFAGFTPTPAFTDGGSGASLRLTSNVSCATGPMLAGAIQLSSLLVIPGQICIVPNSGSGENVSYDCSFGRHWPNQTIGYSTGGAISCVELLCDPPDADLGVIKSVNDSKPKEGSPAQYTMQVTNDGPQTVCDALVTDTWPLGLAYDSSAATHGWYDPTFGSWSIGTLAPGDTATLWIDFHPEPGSANQTIWNGAAVSATADDANNANNASWVSIDVAPPGTADLAVVKTVDDPAPGEGVGALYALTVANQGPDDVFDALVTDWMPLGVVHDSSAATHGSYDDFTGSWSIGFLAAGDSATLWIHFHPGTGSAGQTIWNTANVSATASDPDASDNSSSVSIDVGPPVISATLPQVTTGDGLDVLVPATITNDVYVSATTLHYREGGSPAFSQLGMTRSAEGQWEATVPASSVTIRGVQYFIEVTHTSPNAPGLRAVSYFPETNYRSMNVIVPSQSISLPPASYALLGVPFRAERAGDPLGVFDELAPYDTKRWRYGVWNGTGYLDGPAAAGAVTPGKSFWIYDKNGATVGIGGLSADLTSDHSVVLHAGWNMVASPFAFAVPADQVVRDPGVPLDFVSWNGSGYDHFNATIVPGRGYWVLNTTAAPRTVTFPVGVLPTARMPLAGDPWLPSGDGWAVDVHAASGRAADRVNRFGMRDGATDSLDELDLPEAPAPPADYLVVAFLDGSGALLQVDYRSRRDQGAAWTIAVESDASPHVVRLDFEGVDAAPAEWEVFALIGEARQDLRADPSLETLTGFGATSRRIHVVAGPPAFVRAFTVPAEPMQLVVGPNPFLAPSSTTLSLLVPSPGPASLAVYDVAGRTVRVLHRGPLDAGLRAFSWNGRDESGRDVAAGVYFVRAQSMAASEVKKILVLR